MSTISKRKGKRGVSYLIRVSNGTKENGDPNQESMTWRPPAGMTERQADRQANIEAANFENLVKKGINTEKITFRTLSERYIEDMKDLLKPRTITFHKANLKRINAAIGHLDVKSITANHIQSFIRNLTKIKKQQEEDDKKLSSATVNGYKRTISSILTYGVQEGYLFENVCLGKRIKTPKVDEGAPKMIQPEVINAYLLLFGEAPAKHRAFFHILIGTGARLGEILGLRWSDIDFERGTLAIIEESSYSPEYGIFFTTPKNKTSQRAVTLSQQMVNSLREWKAVQSQEKLSAGKYWLRNPENPKEKYCENHYKCDKVKGRYCAKCCKAFKQSDRVFTGGLGLPMSHSCMLQYIQRMGRKHNLPKVTIHGFRHAVVSMLIDAGEPIPAIASFVGHSSPATTTRVYSHAISQTANRLQNTIAEYLERAK